MRLSVHFDLLTKWDSYCLWDAQWSQYSRVGEWQLSNFPGSHLESSANVIQSNLECMKMRLLQGLGSVVPLSPEIYNSFSSQYLRVGRKDYHPVVSHVD